MIRYYDAQKNALVYVGKTAESTDWDAHWSSHVRKLRIDRFVQKETLKYLPIGSTVIDGGCGFGEKVFSLQKAGFKAIGIDFAAETVRKINEQYPDLNIQQGDVRHLPLKDNSIDGYWSFGVIEHFLEGYEAIADEMKRVIKKDGYLFLTVPTMSPIRKWKSRRNKYPLLVEKEVLKNGFYQFALDALDIKNKFESMGFQCLSLEYLDGVKGFKDELFPHPWMQNLYSSSNIFARITRKILNMLISRWTGHICYLVLKKT